MDLKIKNIMIERKPPTGIVTIQPEKICTTFDQSILFELLTSPMPMIAPINV
jgi:hypothetical protein